MVSVDTDEAKTRLSELLALVEQAGEEVTICRDGKPIARLVAAPGPMPGPLRKNPRLGPVVFLDDPCAPLSEEDWPEEYR